jgi:hypothetical protein
MIEGNLRLIFVVSDSKEIDILYHDFFENEFKTKDIDSQILENIYFNPEFLLDVLNDQNILSSGIFETYGIYTHRYIKPYSYYDNKDWECDWEFKIVKFKRYATNEMKDFLDLLYRETNPHLALHFIDIFNLSDQVNTVRKSDNLSLKNNSLFIF